MKGIKIYFEDFAITNFYDEDDKAGKMFEDVKEQVSDGKDFFVINDEFIINKANLIAFRVAEMNDKLEREQSAPFKLSLSED